MKILQCDGCSRDNRDASRLTKSDFVVVKLTDGSSAGTYDICSICVTALSDFHQAVDTEWFRWKCEQYRKRKTFESELA